MRRWTQEAMTLSTPGRLPRRVKLSAKGTPSLWLRQCGATYSHLRRLGLDAALERG